MQLRLTAIVPLGFVERWSLAPAGQGPELVWGTQATGITFFPGNVAEREDAESNCQSVRRAGAGEAWKPYRPPKAGKVRAARQWSHHRAAAHVLLRNRRDGADGLEGAQHLPCRAWVRPARACPVSGKWRLRLRGVRELGERVPADGHLRHPHRDALPARLGGIAGSRRGERRACRRRARKRRRGVWRGSSTSTPWASPSASCSWRPSRCTCGEAIAPRSRRPWCTASTPPALAAHLGDTQFWFESFQNWQSEFLATAALVVLSIILRFRGSPESKHVDAGNAETGR